MMSNDSILKNESKTCIFGSIGMNRASGSARCMLVSKLVQPPPPRKSLRKSSKIMKPPLSRYARRPAASLSFISQKPASVM